LQEIGFIVAQSGKPCWIPALQINPNKNKRLKKREVDESLPAYMMME
jgi:hypothetical protein